MEEYFLRRCVTSDDAASSPGDTTQLPLSAWQSTGRAERVLVQENRQAHGASRAILSAIVDLTLQSPRTSAVVLFTLDSSQVADGLTHSAKLTHLDYSGDVTNFQLAQASSSGSTPSSSHLLTKILDDINLFEAKAALDSGGSRRIEDEGRPSRPIVVVLDSINVLLQQFSLQRVLFFLRQLHSHLLIGSVIIRLNASAEPAQVAQVLAAQATAVVLVETQSSLRAYPLLSKERRREIPQGKHGFVLLVRQKKNGRSSESLEYFHEQGSSMVFTSATAVDSQSAPIVEPSPTSQEETLLPASSLRVGSDAKPTSTRSVGQTALPVRQEDVSFNLSISADEQVAKSQVQLPYMHQGARSVSSNDTTSAATGNTLFFIDEDDPDWDDDDLDDDLDI